MPGTLWDQARATCDSPTRFFGPMLVAANTVVVGAEDLSNQVRNGSGWWFGTGHRSGRRQGGIPWKY